MKPLVKLFVETSITLGVVWGGTVYLDIFLYETQNKLSQKQSALLIVDEGQ